MVNDAGPYIAAVAGACAAPENEETVPDDPIGDELDAIGRAERAATPGPWGWFGNTDVQSVYLATRRWGRFTVMGFRRWGLQGARPVFATGRSWKPKPASDLDFGPTGRMTPADVLFTDPGMLTAADELPVFEVAPGAAARSDPRVYRADLAGIRNPDAEFIADAREYVPRLLNTVRLMLKLYARYVTAEDRALILAVLTGRDTADG